MDTALGVVVGILVGLALVGLGYLLYRRGKAREAAARTGPAPVVDTFRPEADADALRGDPRTLKPGDLVEIRGRTYGVRGTLKFDEGGWSWAEHLLDDAEGTKVWLSVEEDPDLELALWHEVPSATVKPGKETVDFDGRRYTREEKGTARFTASGTTGLNPQGTVKYQDYAAPDGALLSFESYGSDSGGSADWEVGRGEKLRRNEVQIYPQAA